MSADAGNKFDGKWEFVTLLETARSSARARCAACWKLDAGPGTTKVREKSQRGVTLFKKYETSWDSPDIWVWRIILNFF